jgi:Cof subfamily protein (haloacid dehalogenase superfamily)
MVIILRRLNVLMYKMIAIDMDGTLLKEDKSVSEITKEAIERARKKGVKVVITTGRPVEGITRYLKELNLVGEEDYVISFNGCLIQKARSGKVIYKSILKGSDLTYLYEIGKKLNVNMHAFSNLGCITPKLSKYTEFEVKANDMPANIVDFSAIKPDEEIDKVMMVDEPEILEEAIKKLPKEVYDKYTVVKSTPFFLEFLNRNSNKGEGVKVLAKYLGIDLKEVICIGDAGNDLHMIKFAGLGVAMGNAFEEIKKAADYITSTNEEDGVAEVIEKFILAC